MPNLTKFQIGDIVMYSGAWGSEGSCRCIITGVGEHHGRRVYDNDLDRWGYEEQYRLVFERVSTIRNVN